MNLNFDDFTIVSKIGSGSSSKVFKVKEKKTGKILASKIFRLEINDFTQKENRNLFREIIVMSALEHPSIIKYYGYGYYRSNRPAIFTEFMPNGSLSDLISSEKTSTAPAEWNFTKKLINIYGTASAMSYLHSKDIIHRDLKPENILEDDNFYPKICDFGFSEKFNNDNKQTKSIFGTFFYIAPEILTDNNISKASDVYSFALTIYELLSNQSLFNELGQLSYYRFLNKIASGYRPSLEVGIPIFFRNLIEKCWSSQPSSRPTFDEIVEQLKSPPFDLFDEYIDVDEYNEYIQSIESNNHFFVEDVLVKNDIQIEGCDYSANDSDDDFESEEFNALIDDSDDDFESEKSNASANDSDDDFEREEEKKWPRDDLICGTAKKDDDEEKRKKEEKEYRYRYERERYKEDEENKSYSYRCKRERYKEDEENKSQSYRCKRERLKKNKEKETNKIEMMQNVGKDKKEDVKNTKVNSPNSAYNQMIQKKNEKETINIKPFIILNIKNFDLDQYEKLEQIGIGGSGSVYKIQSTETGLIYAAKVINTVISDNIRDKKIAIDLMREVTILSSIKHISIIRFIGYSPLNFEKRHYPVIVTEYLQNGSLEDLLDYERKGCNIPDWNDTMKLINILGIASSMSYLHSMKIIHRDLKSGNVLIDNFLFPKLADFGFSKSFQQKESNDKVKSDIWGTSPFMAPEIFEDEVFSEATDVYAFSMIVYEIFSKEFPFDQKNDYQIAYKVTHGIRPEINNSIHESIKELIEKCWSQEPEKRPTFSYIVNDLKNNPKYITNNINIQTYNNYINYIDKQENVDIQRNPRARNIFLNHSFHNISLKDIFDIFNKDSNKGNDQNQFINLDNYKEKKEVKHGVISSVFNVVEIKTRKVFSAKISNFIVDNFNKEEKENIIKEMNILKQLNHPAIQKFIGYNLNGFNHHRKPVVLYEHSNNRTLFDIIKEKISLENTNKLIIVYGIASAMQYLNSKGIVHGDLNPKNIIIDDNFHPKLTDIGFYIKVQNSQYFSTRSSKINNELPIYSAPELFKSKKPTQYSDVYSFAMIVYSLISGDFPFKNYKKITEFQKNVVQNNFRPSFSKQFHDNYKQLIEKCWDMKPDNRPSFKEIISELKNNSMFVNDTIVKNAFFSYVRSVDSCQQFTKINNLPSLNKQRTIKTNQNGLSLSQRNISILPPLNPDQKAHQNQLFQNQNNHKRVQSIDNNNNNDVDQSPKNLPLTSPTQNPRFHKKNDQQSNNDNT